jgi:hypothetical protein
MCTQGFRLTLAAAKGELVTRHSSSATQSQKKAPGCKVRWSSPDSRNRRSTSHSRSQLRNTVWNRPGNHNRRSTLRSPQRQ